MDKAKQQQQSMLTFLVACVLSLVGPHIQYQYAVQWDLDSCQHGIDGCIPPLLFCLNGDLI